MSAYYIEDISLAEINTVCEIRRNPQKSGDRGIFWNSGEFHRLNTYMMENACYGWKILPMGSFYQKLLTKAKEERPSKHE